MTMPTDADQPKSRRPLILAAGVMLAVLMLAGVGFALNRSNDDPAPQKLAAAPAATSAAPSAEPELEPALDETAAPSPEPTAPAIKTLKLGQKFTQQTSEFTVEVVALKVKRGDDYEGVQVRACNRGASRIGVSRTPWKLGYDDFESLHDIDISGGGLASPAYEERELGKDECAKGWVNFTIVDGERPDGVQYAPQGEPAARWTF